MLIIAVFVLGYLAIVFEHALRLNKAAIALLTGVFCWTVFAGSHTSVVVNEGLLHHLGGISQILFFLLGAMAIVEQIDAHDGFLILTSRIATRSRRKLLATVAVLTFFLSAVLDNLTTSIVMMSVVRKLVHEDDDRMYLGGVVIIAANAGGAWSPIGDVTTTMLWIGKQVTAPAVMRYLFLPSLVSMLVPAFLIGLRISGETGEPGGGPTATTGTAAPTPASVFEQRLVLFVGLGVLLLVPVWKAVTHLPPVMGILFGLGILWTVTELLHKGRSPETREALSVSSALQRVDASSVLFFLGILLAISALESDGVLTGIAGWMNRRIGNVSVITLAIGLSSSVVDNVPLVAAAQGMYPLSTFATDHHFWLFLAYCAGTGGSILIIGSAAGIAVMGSERISFGWYFRRLSFPAVLGYLAGAAAYMALRWY